MKTYENIKEIAKTHRYDYPTGCSLDYLYFKKMQIKCNSF